MYFAAVMGLSSYSEESEGNEESVFLSLLSSRSSHSSEYTINFLIYTMSGGWKAHININLMLSSNFFFSFSSLTDFAAVPFPKTVLIQLPLEVLFLLLGIVPFYCFSCYLDKQLLTRFLEF